MLTTIAVQNTVTILSGAAILGLIMGSFLNVVIYRLPLMMQRLWLQECKHFLGEHYPEQANHIQKPEGRLNVAWPSSFCPHCKHSLGLLENIPVLSYLIQKGKCKHCSAAISARYPIVETLTAALSVITIYHFGANWVGCLALLLTFGLIALSFIDFDHQILPDDITLPLMWFGLFVNAFLVFTTPSSSVLGAISGYMSLWLVYHLFKFVTGREGMGHGDFKLLALLGAWLGWQLLPLIIILSSLTGAVVGISMIVFKGHDSNQPIPFGPYLAFAGWIALLWGDKITSKYLTYLGFYFAL